MFVHYKTRGLIFKKENRGSADQLFGVFTKDFGKLEILGKGIRKISSKLGPGMEIFGVSEIEFIQGKAHKTLTDAIPVEKFRNIEKDLTRMKVAYKISQALEELIKGQESDPKIWQLLNEAFLRLNADNLKTETCCLIYYYFFWNLLSILGYGPELYCCAVCQKRLKSGLLYFDQDEGGTICQDCSEKTKAAGKIQPETIKILRIILKQDWRTLSRLKIGNEHLKALRIISKNLLY